MNHKLIEKIIQHYLCAVVGKSVSHRGTKIEQISRFMTRTIFLTVKELSKRKGRNPQK